MAAFTAMLPGGYALADRVVTLAQGAFREQAAEPVRPGPPPGAGPVARAAGPAT